MPATNDDDDDERQSPNKGCSETSNAFSVLMSGGGSSSSIRKGSSLGKKRKNNSSSGIVSSKKKNLSPTSIAGSRFVQCPAGCGRHVLPHEVNAHLDKCIGSEHFQDRNQQSQPSGQTVATDHLSDNTIAVSDSEQIQKGTHRPNQGDENSTNDVQSRCQGKSDIFSHMMKRASEIFTEGGSYTSSSSAGTHKLVQRMHLHTDGSVSLTCYGRNVKDDVTLHGQSDPIMWSATVQVKCGKEVPVELIVSSSIPQAVDMTTQEQMLPSSKRRLVRKHSRLSVPVLKSILQKSIRRRKPLPSVRVAMELADKSFGDLLRRLPIIVVEDSTLHPDVPLLVWLMIASSKDYNVPLTLMKRTLQIVCEVASCRWKDDTAAKRTAATGATAASDSMIPVSSDTGEATTTHCNSPLPPSSISSLHKISTTGSDHSLSSVDVLLWSLLMRSHYGGMAGDVLMLRGYAETWHHRFHGEKGLPEDMVQRLAMVRDDDSTNPNKGSRIVEWSQVPAYIHQVAAAQSPLKIDNILFSSHSQFPQQQQLDSSAFGLPCLFATDLTSEGVDFHCSSVLETAVLSDIDFLYECYEYLERSTLPSSVTPFPTNEGTTTSTNSMAKDLLVRRRCWLESLLKSLMWNHSAGVNLRLPLVPQNHDICNSPVRTDVLTKSVLKVFWETKIRPRTKAYSERYVQERLARS
jgi:hypothetical protein